MSVSALDSMLCDSTARKVHQWAMVAMVGTAFLLPDRAGIALLAAAGTVMLLGNFWLPADIFRQLTWRVLEPRGILRRCETQADIESRRVARVVGGVVWLGSAVLVLLHMPVLPWVLALGIAVMVALDAANDLCLYCFVVGALRR
jgi:Domain of unknown function (DUF4395)